MKWYSMTPQPHALGAPKLQDAFRNITAPQFQTPTSVSTPMKQYTLWESVNTENINVLNHIFWFNSANIKATEEMEKQFNIIKSAESEVDFNNAMDYVQECLQLQSTINQSLGKSLESLLGSSMTLSSNVLLNRRDNYLKHCSKDVTEDDISRLRNASFTPNEVFPVETLSEVQRNFIQWAHVNRDSFKSRKEHPARHDDRREVNPRAGLFVPTVKVQPPAPQQLALQLATEVEVPSLPGPLEAGVVEGSDCLVPGGRLSTFWQVWEPKRAHPRVVTILKEGYCLNFRLKPPLTKVPVIRSKYLNREKQEFLIKAVYQMIDKRAITPVQKVTSLGFYSRLFLVTKPGKKWRPVIDLSVVNKYLHVPTFKMETAKNIRDSLQEGEWVTSLDLTDAYFHIPIHPRFQKYLRFNVGDRSYQFIALPFGIATAPLEFTMVAKEVKLMALAQGIRIHQYIDDWLMRAKTKQECQENTHRLIHLVQSLGWIINFEKSDLIPTQKIDFLGYKFDLRVGLLYPTQKKIDRLLEKTVSMLKATQTSPRELMSLIGSMASMEKTVPLGRLHVRPLQWYLKTHWRYPQSLDIPVPVSQVLKQHLQWWTNLSNLRRGSPLIRRSTISFYSQMLP